MSFRVHSHLARSELLFQNLVHFLSLVRLGIYEHGNRAWIRTKTITRLNEEVIVNELWRGSVELRKQSDPTDKRTKRYHNS